MFEISVRLGWCTGVDGLVEIFTEDTGVAIKARVRQGHYFISITFSQRDALVQLLWFVLRIVI